MVTVVILVKPLNQSWLIVIEKPSAKVMVLRPVQFWNALVPTLVTPAPIVMLARLVQFWNAD